MKGTLRFCGLVPDSCVIPLATKILSGHGIARKLDDSNGCNDEDLNLMRGLSAWRGLGAWPALYSAVIKHGSGKFPEKHRWLSHVNASGGFNSTIDFWEVSMFLFFIGANLPCQASGLTSWQAEI